MSERSLRASAVTVLAALVVGVGLAVALLTASGAAPWTTGSYKLSVMLPTAGALGPDVSVRISGQRVGKVTEVQRKGTMAKITLAIDDAKVPLPEDTRAALRLRTLVGENYVELTPGRSTHTLKSGATLPVSQQDRYEEADQVLSVLRGETRERARELLQRLGNGLDGQGPRLNSFLRHASPAVDNASDVAAVLAHDHRQVAALVQHVGDITRAIGDRQDRIRELARSSRETFQALSDRQAALRSTLVGLPPTLRVLRRVTATVGSVSGTAAPVIDDLALAIRDLQPAVRNLGPAATQGQRLVGQLTPAAPRLQGVLRRARALAPGAVKALPQVGAVTCQLNPAVKYLAPYIDDLTALLANMASATNFYDGTGHAARLYAMAGQTSLAAISPDLKSVVDRMLNLGILQTVQSQGYNPYGTPGNAVRPRGGEGKSGPMDKSVAYPRVQAEC